MMFLEKVVKSLNSYRVQYMLIGGYAVAMHGAVRGTVDVDLVIAMNQRSYRNVEKALNSIGLESRLPITANDVFAYREEYINKRNLFAWSFVNPNNPLEIVDVLITEDAKKLRSVTKTFNGISVKIAALDDLIELKRKSARKQDIEDIRALEKLK